MSSSDAVFPADRAAARRLRLLPRPAKAAVVLAAMLAVTASRVHAQSPLADRIEAGDRAAALAMIASGANVNQPQSDGTTPLQWAAYRVDRELVQRLLRRGATANTTNRYGASPIHEAVRVADPGLVTALLSIAPSIATDASRFDFGEAWADGPLAAAFAVAAST